MSTDAVCPQCHSPLPPDAPAGLCPRCLIKSAAGFDDAPTVATGGGIPNIADPAEVSPRLPQFEIIELLGQGGMGVVYKARQPALDRMVALKILPPAEAVSPDFVERFRREARALAKLNHPNIVAVHECGESGGLYYFAMEYVDGVNLRALLCERKLTPAEALAIVPKICDALEFAHDEGVIHRDIKPENLLIDKKGRVKIADFGLAKLLRRESLDVTLTLSGAQLGTLRYMAPEQMEKPESVDHRADIYSLGVVIYEMLTGEVPMGRFAPPSEKAPVDVRLDEIVLRTLERDVDRRYQHASEVRTAVESVAQPVASAGAPARQNSGGASRWRTFFRRLAEESFTGKAALVVAVVALDARKLPWHSLIVPGNQVLSPANSLVVNAKMSEFMLGLALVTALFASAGGLAGFARMLVRALAGIFTMAALWFQISFLFTLGKWEPGLTGKVLQVTRSYPEPGLYVTITFSALALLFFVLRFFEEKGAEKRDSVAGANMPPANAVRTPGETLVLLAGVSLLAAFGLLLWKALTKLPEAFPEAVVLAITLAGHGLFIGAAGWFMSRLRARMFVLGCLVLAGLLVPAVVAVNVIMELERIPQWPVAIPLWLAMPACVWAITVLFRDDVCGTFGSDATAANDVSSRGQRPGRLALCGGILAVLLAGAAAFWLPHFGQATTGRGETQQSNSETRDARASAEQIRVEDNALRLLAAIRDREDNVLRELASGQNKNWPDALPQFAFELREKHQHEFAKPFALWPTESLVDGDFAVVKCTSKETEEKLQGWYLGLFFIRDKDGTWRNASLRGTTANMTLSRLLTEFKTRDLAAAPQEK